MLSVASHRNFLLLPAIFSILFIYSLKQFCYEEKLTRSKSGRAGYVCARSACRWCAATHEMPVAAATAAAPLRLALAAMGAKH
jgi:hypothetical protein